MYNYIFSNKSKFYREKKNNNATPKYRIEKVNEYTLIIIIKYLYTVDGKHFYKELTRINRRINNN